MARSEPSKPEGVEVNTLSFYLFGNPVDARIWLYVGCLIHGSSSLTWMQGGRLFCYA